MHQHNVKVSKCILIRKDQDEAVKKKPWGWFSKYIREKLDEDSIFVAETTTTTTTGEA